MCDAARTPRRTHGRTAAPRRRANNRPQVPFAHKLVLNQWLLSLFNVERFEELAEHLRNEALEGLDENNVHHFHHALTAAASSISTAAAHRAAARVRPEHRQAHAAPERAAHHARRGADRLEVLPVPGAALHRDLPRPLLPRPQGAARGAQRADRRATTPTSPRPTRSRPSTRPLRPGRSSTSSPSGWRPAAARRC